MNERRQYRRQTAQEISAVRKVKQGADGPGSAIDGKRAIGGVGDVSACRPEDYEVLAGCRNDNQASQSRPSYSRQDD